MASAKISIMAARIRIKSYQDPHYPPGTRGVDIGGDEPQWANIGTNDLWEDANPEELDAALREAISENTYSDLEELATGDYYVPVSHEIDHDHVTFTVVFNENKRQDAEAKRANPDMVADRFDVVIRNPHGG